MENIEISEVQQLQLRLIELASFNSMDGERVVADLRVHRDLWDGALLDRQKEQLIKLRDLPDGDWNADTLFVLTTQERLPQLMLLAHHWGADQIDLVEGVDLGREFGVSEALLGGRVVLRLWWV